MDLLDDRQKAPHQGNPLAMRPLWTTRKTTITIQKHMERVINPIYADPTTAAAMLSVSKSTIQRLTREDATFPKPRQISGRRVGFLVRELNEWAEKRPVSKLLPPA